MNNFYYNKFKRIIFKIIGVGDYIQDLEKRLMKIEKELGFDSNFGIWNKSGLLYFAKKQPRGIKRYLVYLDLDNLHNLNNTFGYEKVDEKIKNMFRIQLRESDFIGKFFSGDEFIIVTGPKRQEASTVLNKLKESAEENGLAFTSVIGVWDTNEELEEVAMVLAQKVLDKKKKRKQQERM